MNAELGSQEIHTKVILPITFENLDFRLKQTEGVVYHGVIGEIYDLGDEAYRELIEIVVSPQAPMGSIEQNDELTSRLMRIFRPSINSYSFPSRSSIVGKVYEPGMLRFQEKIGERSTIIKVTSPLEPGSMDESWEQNEHGHFFKNFTNDQMRDINVEVWPDPTLAQMSLAMRGNKPFPDEVSEVEIERYRKEMENGKFIPKSYFDSIANGRDPFQARIPFFRTIFTSVKARLSQVE